MQMPDRREGGVRMKKRNVLRPHWGDLLAALLVAVCAAGLLLGLTLRGTEGERTAVEVYHRGRLLYTLPLDRDGEWTVEGTYKNVITIRDGRVAVTASDCPGGDCVHMGWESRAGRGIVCLPNRLELRLTGVSDVDAVVG